MSTEMMVEKVSGSKLIREVLKGAGKIDTSAREVIETIKEKYSQDVSEALVNNVRCRLKKAREERKQEREKKVVAVQVEVIQSEFDKFLLVKELAGKVGGMDSLKDLVNKLERLAC